MQEFITARLAHYAAAGEIKYASPRRPGKKVIVYCTYGGAHTGANEAICRSRVHGPIIRSSGFRNLVSEWYFIGQYPATGRMKDFSAAGRLGNITGRPNASDLAELAERVRGILRV